MTAVMEEGIEQLLQEFAEARISTEQPGFYEDGAFIRREQKIPHYLDNYADSSISSRMAQCTWTARSRSFTSFPRNCSWP